MLDFQFITERGERYGHGVTERDAASIPWLRHGQVNESEHKRKDWYDSLH